MEIKTVSQAVNADIPMNHSSGAAVTWYKCCNIDRAAAKLGIIYQMGVIGDECDEVWNEDTSRKELKDRIIQE